MMPERLVRLRGPAAVVLLVVLTLRIVLAVVGFVLEASGTTSTGQRAASAVNAGAVASDPLTTVVLALLLAGCVLWSPLRQARLLLSWALAVVGVGLVGALAADVAYLVAYPTGASSLLDAAQLLLRLAVPSLVLLALVRLRPAASTSAGALTGASPAAAIEAPAVAEPEPDPALEPDWRPDQAAGAAWMKAGDAAAGSAASGWGSPGDAGGWSPQPRAEPRSDPATFPSAEDRRPAP